MRCRFNDGPCGLLVLWMLLCNRLSEHLIIDSRMNVNYCTMLTFLLINVTARELCNSFFDKTEITLHLRIMKENHVNYRENGKFQIS
jgi:hypothetical protein